MNTDELKKLYRDVQNDAAPDFWDKIDAGLKPHTELTEEETNAFTEFEETEITAAGESRNKNGNTRSGKTPLQLDQYRKKKSVGGWIAAAAAAVICIPALLLLSGNSRNRMSAETAADDMEFSMAATAAAPVMEEAAAPIVKDEGTASFSGEEAVMRENAATVQEAAAGEDTFGYAQLLTVPENAVTVPADSVYFTEEILAQTDMLAMATVEDAAFATDAQGRAYQLNYNVTVQESLLEEGESGKTGSRIRICSPIVSDGVPGGKILYQLIPGETYILPLKKNNGEWELISPTSPQIRLHEDGSFEFHTGYTDLINEDTEVVFDTQASDDDFWFDRKVSRSDPDFIPELKELVKFEKKSK